MNADRFKEIEDGLDPSIKMKLDEIRKFLDAGKASVMVGAGFSKNAEMPEDVSMKDWGELCEDLHSALYDSKSRDSDLRFKSAPRIAQQFESTFGRSALDEMVKSSIPNDSISPGELHKRLVELNWRDIFTTNYDTLLEEAAENAFRHYNVVTSKDSLIYQSHPRIVKLHGSFPDNRPFIITEEDYRTYPAKFPEFVNTIRQALIETQFCLIGFSGDDPNFLSWLGWFRDIMGKQMRPIYMIYVGRPHDSEMNLLRQRKVEPIITDDISEDRRVALDFILCYLKSKKDETWSGRLDFSSFKMKDLKESIENMCNIRKSYPGWIILPADKIETDFEDCRSEFPFMGKRFSELDDEDKLNFLYEYTWRLQTSLMPSWLNTEWYIGALQEVLNRYDSIEGEDRNKADYLSVVLLQIHRIVGDDGFNKELIILRERIPQNNFALHRRLNYEEALWAISHCDRKRVEDILKRWNIILGDYRDVLWKAKILVEIGKSEEAVKILEVSLDDARRKLLSNNKSGYLLSAVTLISECIACNRYSRSRNGNVDERFRMRRYFDLCKKELNTEDKHGKVRSYGFNIGSQSTSWSSGSSGYIMKYVGAGRYYLLTETYGFPIGSESMTYCSDINQLALPLIVEANLRAALSYLLETNDRNAFNVTISRQAILNISEKTAKEMFDSWIKVLEPYMESRDKLSWRGRESVVVLPLLARLSVWLDPDRIMKIVRFMWKIYDYGVNDFSKLLITCYNSLPIDKAVDVWREVMEHPIILNYRKEDLVKPNVTITKCKGNASMANAVLKGLSDDSLDVRRSAVDRLGHIYTVIPQESRESIDKAIADNFDNLLNTDLVPILGSDLNSEDERTWKVRFYSYLNEQVDKFKESDFKISGSSAAVDAFCDQMVTFIYCYQHLKPEQLGCIFRKVSDFINENFNVLCETNDSDSMFGGLKRFLDSAMNNIKVFVTSVDRSLIQSDVRRELIEKLKQLIDKYPLISLIVYLTFVHGVELDDEVENTYQFIKKPLENAILSSDINRMKDAFYAVEIWWEFIKGDSSIQEIVRIPIDYIRYSLDEKSENVLSLLPDWVRSKIITGQNVWTLFDVLSSLPQMLIDNKSMAAELKSNILYRGAFLAGVISKSDFTDAEGRKCVEIWQTFAESNFFPHDIRNGYYEGAQ